MPRTGVIPLGKQRGYRARFRFRGAFIIEESLLPILSHRRGRVRPVGLQSNGEDCRPEVEFEARVSFQQRRRANCFHR
jgi:hypothetical protein